MNDRFIVVTEFGSVAVSINPEATNGLDNELLQFAHVTDADTEASAFETPLRAFAVKMVDLIMEAGFEGVSVPESMRDMLVREKATEELARIERWAKLNH